MMEPLFENRFTWTEETNKEFAAAWTYQRREFVLLIAFISVVIVMTTVGIICNTVPRTPYEIFLIVVILILFCTVLRTWFRFKQSEKIYLIREREKCHGQVSEQITFVGEDYTHVHVLTGNTWHYELEVIARYRESKHMLYLLTAGGQCLIFNKDGFVKGTLEEFKAFLKERYPQFKMK